MKEPIRITMIDAIIDLAGDEYVHVSDVIKLAKKSDEQLILELINIAEYFREQSNNN